MSDPTASTPSPGEPVWPVPGYTIARMTVIFSPNAPLEAEVPAVPAAGRLVRLYDELYRVLAHVDGRLMMAHLRTNVIYLVEEGAAGDLRLPPFSLWIDLTRSGHAKVMPMAEREDRSECHPRDVEAARISLQCDMLDAADIPLGTKCMEIWLHRHWTPDLVAMHGPHDSAHTLRRWRRMRNRGTQPRPSSPDPPD
ncbi:hypothetical protein [Sphingomonas sp. Leaf257]|uniref:hypothetical protein n=1 Tax=Sphingomonas sp. Leaf257 TaxID=1736309 RepID=UPI000A58D5F9|nr:hypothetical protein [Sphingomonas sp. Leaf257]